MTDGRDDLGDLRAEIDRIDGEIAELAAECARLAERVAAVKAREGTDLVDEGREETVVSRYESTFRHHDVGGGNGRELARLLIGISLRREREIASGQ